MSGLALAALMIVIGSAAALWWLRTLQRQRKYGDQVVDSLRTVIEPQVRDELQQVHRNVQRQALALGAWWTPSADVKAHPALANVESALVTQRHGDAVNLAEMAMASAPSDPSASLLLAWALVNAGHAGAAGAQMLKLQTLPHQQWQL